MLARARPRFQVSGAPAGRCGTQERCARQLARHVKAVGMPKFCMQAAYPGTACTWPPSLSCSAAWSLWFLLEVTTRARGGWAGAQPRRPSSGEGMPRYAAAPVAASGAELASMARRRAQAARHRAVPGGRGVPGAAGGVHGPQPGRRVCGAAGRDRAVGPRGHHLWPARHVPAGAPRPRSPGGNRAPRARPATDARSESPACAPCSTLQSPGEEGVGMRTRLAAVRDERCLCNLAGARLQHHRVLAVARRAQRLRRASQ